MRRWILAVSIVFAPLMSNCAKPLPPSRVAPQLGMPAEARRPCELHRLPAAPTEADLEIGYAARGAQIAACDAARRLAVETHDAEHALEDAAAKTRRR